MNYESTDASLRVIGVSSAVVATLVVLALGASVLLYSHHGDAESVRRQTSFTAGPREEPAVLREWRKVDATADQRLHGFRWVDRERGIARIPIDRAMELVAEGRQPDPGAPVQPTPSAP